MRTVDYIGTIGAFVLVGLVVGLIVRAVFGGTIDAGHVAIATAFL